MPKSTYCWRAELTVPVQSTTESTVEHFALTPVASSNAKLDIIGVTISQTDTVAVNANSITYLFTSNHSCTDIVSANR
jgi:hypothetical protein